MLLVPYETGCDWNALWLVQHLAFRQHSPGMYEHCQQRSLWVILTKITKTTYWFKVSTNLRYENRIHVFPLHNRSRHFITCYVHEEPGEVTKYRTADGGGGGAHLPVMYKPCGPWWVCILWGFSSQHIEVFECEVITLGNLNTIVKLTYIHILPRTFSSTKTISYSSLCVFFANHYMALAILRFLPLLTFFHVAQLRLLTQ